MILINDSDDDDDNHFCLIHTTLSAQ